MLPTPCGLPLYCVSGFILHHTTAKIKRFIKLRHGFQLLPRLPESKKEDICFQQMSSFWARTVNTDICSFGTVNRNTIQRPFWAARRAARKFSACGRELRRGSFAGPEH